MPDDLSHVLRQLGYTVVLLRDTADPDVLAYAHANDFVLQCD